MIVDLYKLTKITFTPVKARIHRTPHRNILTDTYTKAGLLETKNGIYRITTYRNMRNLKKRVLSHDFSPYK